MSADIPIGEVVYFDAITTNPSTGAVSDADSTPTFEVFEEATDTDIGVGGNFTKRTSKTGDYRGSFTASLANGFEVGKWYSVIGYATVNSIAGKACVKNFRCVSTETTVGIPEVNVSTISGDSTAADNLKKSLLTMVTATVNSGASTTSIPTSACSLTTTDVDQLKGRIVIFIYNTTTTGLRCEATDITASTASATPTLTVTALTRAPASGDLLIIV